MNKNNKPKNLIIENIFKLTSLKEIRNKIEKKVKEIKFYLKKLFLNQNTIKIGDRVNLIFKERISDFDFYNSKLTNKVDYKSKIFPLNKLESFDEFSIEFYFESEIFENDKIRIIFDLLLDDKKIGESFEYNFTNNDFKNIKKTKKWLKITHKMNERLNLNNSNVCIQLKELNINSKNNFCTLKIYNNENAKKNIYLIILDGIHSRDFEEYSKNINPYGIFNDFINNKKYLSNVISPSTVTGSSLPSILTNNNVLQHQVFQYEYFKNTSSKIISQNIDLLPEILLENKYHCMGVTNFSRMRPHFAMNMGFHDYINISSGPYYYSSFLDNVFSNISYSKKTNTFNFFHYTGGHPPFEPEINNKFKFKNLEKNFYYSNIKNSEQFIENIITKIKNCNLYEESLILISSDHGNSLNNFSFFGDHSIDDRIRVPFILLDETKSNEKINYNDLLISNEIIFKSIENYTKIKIKNNNLDNYDSPNIKWTTIFANYKKKNNFFIIGYEKKYKWKFETKFDSNMKSFQILDNFEVFDLDEDFYSISSNNKISPSHVAKIKNHLNEYISLSIKNSSSTVTQNSRSIYY